jgi:hypothetical protein
LEKTEYKGSWWLPEKPTTIIPGSLQLETGGRITLELLGALTETELPRPQSVPLVLGKSTNGESITLYGCIQTNTSFGVEGVRTSSLYVVAALIGAHFPRPDDIRFGRIDATFPQLEDWVGSSGAKIDHPDTQTLVVTKRSTPLATAILRDAKISIAFQFAERIGRDETSVRYVPNVTIEMTNESHLRKVLDILYHLRNFFALAACHPVYPESIDARTEALKVTFPDGRSYHTPVKIVYHDVNWGVPHDSVNMRGILFELGAVRVEFETLLRNWFEKAELLEPVFDMYFGTMYNPSMYLQHKFLSLAQCVESYHRRAVRNYELPPDQAEKRIQAILDAAPDEYKEWLENKLRYSNELTLRKRLEDLLNTYSFLKFDDGDQFIDDVINTRNYLTHYDVKLKESAANPAKLSKLAMGLKVLTETILLTELGLSLDKIKSIMQRIGEIRSEMRSFDF